MKRVCAIVLAFCLTVGCMAFVVSAESNILTLDTPTTVSADGMYTFVPTQAGYYMISGQNDNSYVDVYIGSENPDWGSSARFYAEANQTVDISISPYGTDIFTITKLSEATAVTLDRTTYIGYVGDFPTFYLESLTPDAMAEIYSVYVSDNTVISADIFGVDFVDVELLKAGTATVTITTRNGLTASAQITVKEPEEIKLNQTITSEFAEDQQKRYVFTPTADGIYTFKDSSGDLWMSLNCATENCDNGYVFKAEAGQVVELKVSAFDAGTYSVTLGQGKEAAAISFAADAPDTMYLDQCAEFVVETDTVDGYIGNLTWTFSDTTAMSVFSYVGEPCGYLTAKKVGTVTVTATTQAGKSVSKTVRIVDNPEIKTGEEKTVDQTTVFKYMPAEDGEYVVYGDAGGYLLDAEGSYLDYRNGTNVNYEYVRIYDLTANTQYKLEAEAADVVGVKKFVADTNYVIVGDSSTIVGAYVDLEISTEGFAVKEDLGEWTWTVSDESVLKIEDAYFTDCYLESLKIGTVTVTATNKLGQKATKTVEVVGMLDFLYEIYSKQEITAGGNKVVAENAVKDHSVTIKGDAKKFSAVFIVKNFGDTLDEEEIMDDESIIQLTVDELVVKQNGNTFTVTIPGAQLQKLGVGNHQLLFASFGDAQTMGAMTRYTIKAIDNTNPPTGDRSLVAPAMIVMIGAVLGMGVTLYTSRKKEI